MTDSPLEASLWITRQASGIVLAVLAIWVAVGPEVRAILRRLRGTRLTPNASVDPSTARTSPTASAAESRAA